MCVLTVAFADVELLANLCVREAARNQTKNVQLAIRQLLELLRRLNARNARELLDHPLRDRGGQQRVSARHDANRLEELFGWVVLQDELAGAGSERLVDVLRSNVVRINTRAVSSSARIRRVASGARRAPAYGCP